MIKSSKIWKWDVICWWSCSRNIIWLCFCFSWSYTKRLLTEASEESDSKTRLGFPGNFYPSNNLVFLQLTHGQDHIRSSKIANRNELVRLNIQRKLRIRLFFIKERLELGYHFWGNLAAVTKFSQCHQVFISFNKFLNQLRVWQSILLARCWIKSVLRNT